MRQIGDCALFLLVALALMLVWLFAPLLMRPAKRVPRQTPYTVGGCLLRNWQDWDDRR